MPRWGRVLLWSIAAAVVLVLGYFGFATFVLTSGWPYHHISQPALARGLAWNSAEKSSAALTARLRQRFPPGTPAAQVVDALDREGFLFGSTDTCRNNAPGVLVWLRGCRNTDADLALLRSARQGWMTYVWGGFICSFSVTAHWEVQSDHRIRAISARYAADCFDDEPPN